MATPNLNCWQSHRYSRSGEWLNSTSAGKIASEAYRHCSFVVVALRFIHLVGLREATVVSLH